MRSRYAIAEDAVLFGVFGGLTPEKRLPQILAAFRALLPHAPAARLLLAGAPAAHYDVVADVAAARAPGPRHADGLPRHGRRRHRSRRRVRRDAQPALADRARNLRPVAPRPRGRQSDSHHGPRPSRGCAFAGSADVDGERRSAIGSRSRRRDRCGNEPEDDGQSPETPRIARSPHFAHRSPVCVAIDILDEDHSLRLAMRRLAADAALRDELGRAAREWWAREQSIEAMADDYERVMREAASRPDPRVDLPAHMRDAGDRKLDALAETLRQSSLSCDHHPERRRPHRTGPAHHHRPARAARDRPARRRGRTQLRRRQARRYGATPVEDGGPDRDRQLRRRRVDNLSKDDGSPRHRRPRVHVAADHRHREIPDQRRSCRRRTTRRAPTW